MSVANVKYKIAVASGKGGVGKSTVCVNLAFALAKQGYKVGILDADIYGPSIPNLVARVEPKKESKGGSSQNTITPPEVGGVKIVSMALFAQAKDASILRGPMAGTVIKQFLNQVEWGELDFLLIDYPPGTGDIQLTLSQSTVINGALIVTTPQDVAIIDVRKAIAMFAKTAIPVIGVIETMSYFKCDQCSKKHLIFMDGGGEKIAREADTKLLIQIPLSESIVNAGQVGIPLVLTMPSHEASELFYALAHQLSTWVEEKLSKKMESGSKALDNFSIDWR